MAGERQRAKVPSAAAPLNVLWRDDPAPVVPVADVVAVVAVVAAALGAPGAPVVVVAASGPVVVGAAPWGAGAAPESDPATSIERAVVTRDRSSPSEETVPKSEMTT
jgi:hypothetical protein